MLTTNNKQGVASTYHNTLTVRPSVNSKANATLELATKVGKEDCCARTEKRRVVRGNLTKKRETRGKCEKDNPWETYVIYARG